MESLAVIPNENSSLSPLHGMKRPFLDNLATTLFQLETARVDASSEIDDKGRMGRKADKAKGELPEFEQDIQYLRTPMYALPKDELGDPLISEDIVEAILAFLNWMYLERERNKSRGTRKFPFSEVEAARIRFLQFKGMVQGNIKMPSPLAAEVMIRKWVTLIPDFKNKRRNSKNSRFNTRY